ncbi:hypothetical protein Slin15195_G118240 [Septoria linicola]|uniref:DUF1993 domain-containing protein n=1 Tax=Septoria linicola TaxID=215465 RepID=A0A9Q9B0M8_9PEZI|nr:hypothetical protein Slin14017_G095240 [Septoria linicola]USW58505.1 hypothetical protein Slin15195_G118240 [Septoria linicola]
MKQHLEPGNLHIAESYLPAELAEGVNTLEELYDQLDEMTTVLKAAKPEEIAGKRDMIVKFGPPGREPWEFTGLSFVQEFLLVNVVFHATTAYNILRMQGVPLGKMDFIGKTGNQ